MVFFFLKNPILRIHKKDLIGEKRTVRQLNGVCVAACIQRRGLCLKGQLVFHCSIYMSQQPCVQSKCPWARQWAGKVEKSGEEGSSLSPKRRKRQPKQTQISCALLRRQGAEHGVLVDATKPLKTNLPPSILFILTLTHSVYIDIIPWRPRWLNINAQSRVMIRSKKTVIVL